MRAGSNKYSADVRHTVARLLATTDLGQRDIAFLARVPQTQVSRWARDPEFNQLVEKLRRELPSLRDDEPPEDDSGEWITVVRYKKSGGNE
jgi:hypothetical protein